MTSNATTSDRDDELADVLLAYIEACEEGTEPDREIFIAAHSEFKDDLAEFFAGRDEVERLIGPVLEPGILPPEEPASALGLLGDFRLIREIGRGGMGLVYEAQQLSLRRQVALKVLPFAASVDPRRLQRFQNEAAAAAHLRHENIVPVYAVGCERGVHYYAMQFVEGQSLAALLSELRAADESPAGLSYSTEAVAQLTTERRSGNPAYFDWVAGLTRQAALALDHAHETGVVHRDIKPGNLLLDTRGQLWVADFGLALVAGDSGLTVTGELLGTLRYASPEQALGRRGIVDHRSDIYSLGATLYEMLTLQPPFDGIDRHELLRQISEATPPNPRSIAPSIPLTLETIVLKALRKEPADRYSTAQEFAADLQRFLERRPVLARPPSAGEQFRMWARRHPAAFLTFGLMSVMLTVGSVITAALVGTEQERTRAAQNRAEDAYVRARERAIEAEARLALARRAVDELFSVSEEELADRPGMEMLRKRVLLTALSYYEELLDKRGDDSAARSELLDTTHRVEQILSDLAALRSSSRFYLLRQAVVRDALELAPEQITRLHSLTIKVSREWADSFRDIGLVSPAERSHRSIVHARANEAELNSILTPEQQSRLQQIGLQSEGSAAFRDPEVAELLGLTPDQRNRVRVIEDDAAFGWMRRREKKSDADERPTEQRLVEVLTPEQALKWRELIGDPIRGLLVHSAGSRSARTRFPGASPRVPETNQDTPSPEEQNSSPENSR
jgi:serine/threonine protein kinase